MRDQIYNPVTNPYKISCTVSTNNNLIISGECDGTTDTIVLKDYRYINQALDDLRQKVLYRGDLTHHDNTKYWNELTDRAHRFIKSKFH